MVQYIDNIGNSVDTAIEIFDCNEHFAGIQAEYDYIAEKYGKKNIDWKMNSQALLNDNNKAYDRIDVELRTGEKLSIYFDITGFFGKGFD